MRYFLRWTFRRDSALFDKDVFRIYGPTALPTGFHKTQQTERMKDGPDIKHDWEIKCFQYKGQGCPLSSYLRKCQAFKDQFIEWTFLPVCDTGDTVAKQIAEAAAKRTRMFPDFHKDFIRGGVMAL